MHQTISFDLFHAPMNHDVKLVQDWPLCIPPVRKGNELRGYYHVRPDVSNSPDQMWRVEVFAGPQNNLVGLQDFVRAIPDRAYYN
jgi:hypothetical protein